MITKIYLETTTNLCKPELYIYLSYMPRILASICFPPFFLAPFMPWLLPTLDLPTGESRSISEASNNMSIIRYLTRVMIGSWNITNRNFMYFWYKGNPSKINYHNKLLACFIPPNIHPCLKSSCFKGHLRWFSIKIRMISGKQLVGI